MFSNGFVKMIKLSKKKKKIIPTHKPSVSYVYEYFYLPDLMNKYEAQPYSTRRAAGLSN